VGLSVAQGVASTPEPGTACLLLAGLGWACLSSRRRPRPAAPRAQA
ncbi:MAG: PEP-CTERM sorting domain-containing protein, partial [Lentisphaerae bacterium]|nr:PEP-CTERM sorting domain-containing protein [Lentisphaerota bacterium]